MKSFFTIALIWIQCIVTAQNKLGAIGSWRGHFDTHSITQIIKGDYIYAASPYQIIKLDAKNNPTWIDKTTGLSDIGIELIAWDPINKQLIASYANSNIDIIKGDQIYNINAIALTNLYPNHKINSLYLQNNWAWVATNFGIVVVDLIKHEIKDTWFPNNNQQPTICYDVTASKDSLFVATDNGIWTTTITSTGINNNQWAHLSQYDGLNIKKLIQFNNTIIGYNSTHLFQFPFNNSVYTLNNGAIRGIDNANNFLNIAISYPNQQGAIIQLNNNYNAIILLDSTMVSTPCKLVYDNGNYWIADSSKGIVQKGNTINWIGLGGLSAPIQGLMSSDDNNLLAPYNNKAGYAHFNESGWNSYAQITSKQLPVLYASTQSKSDQSFWFTSNQGLVHIANNTTLETIQPNANTGAYKTIQSDKNNLIWVVQENQGLVRQSNNAWTNIPVPSNLLKSGLDQFIINNNQQAWMIAPNSQGIYVYQSKDVFSNEIWVQLVTQAGHGNLPSNHVTSLAVDKTGSIWVGTDNGIGIFNCGDVSNEPCNAYLPIVNNNGFNGYLFQKEIVNCIAIDGANRKWIGTHNGAWLLSSDGLEIIEHFTSLTSPLPTDTITQITIAPNSGEVFFNTTKQMVSYRGTATKSVTTQNAIDIYPNPVGPNFAGPIAFRGLVENAVVKITDLTGRLLYQTKALGGQAVWNGRTYEGKKVATGIYLVFVRDLAGNEKGVGKIVIADGY